MCLLGQHHVFIVALLRVPDRQGFFCGDTNLSPVSRVKGYTGDRVRSDVDRGQLGSISVSPVEEKGKSIKEYSSKQKSDRH